MIVLNRRQLLAGSMSMVGVATLPSLGMAAETLRLTMASSHPTTLPWVGVLSEHVVGRSNERLAVVTKSTGRKVTAVPCTNLTKLLRPWPMA